MFETQLPRHGIAYFVPLLAILLSWVVEVEATCAQAFRPLTNVPGHDWSEALAVSGDGTVVVGRSFQGANSVDIVHWTVTGEYEVRGAGQAVDVSEDGSAVVGCVDCDAALQVGDPVRWVNGVVGPVLETLVESQVSAISSNGSVVVGHSSANRALLWTSTTGTVDISFVEGGLLGGGLFTHATDVSSNGAVIVGFGNTAFGKAAFRRALTEHAVSIGDLEGGAFSSRATAVSSDGSTIVGIGTGANGEQAFRWTTGDGMEALANLPGFDYFSEPLDLSADGALIVGAAASSSEPADRVAFLWDAEHGMRNLQDVLVNDYHLDLNGWQLSAATGISSDGLTIVGNAPQGPWLAQLHRDLAADFDEDGDVDGDDLGIWQQHFGTSPATPAMGDTDEDGDVDGHDFLTLQREFGFVAGLGSGGGGLVDSSAAIPEPASLGLMASATLALLALKRSNSHHRQIRTQG